MIKLTEVTEDNWLKIATLSVKDNQKNYVAPAIGILARGYVYFMKKRVSLILGISMKMHQIH